MCTCQNISVQRHFCCHEAKVQTLGLVANFRRTIKNGSQFDELFPKANLTDKIINPNGSVKYTVTQMEQVVADYNWQTTKIAKLLETDTLPQTLENIWNFFYQHYQYKLDKEGVEELRTPARAWHDGQILARNPNTANNAGIDCDCFAISVSSVLTNLKIKHKLRVTKYGGGWQHVYVVVPVPSNAGYNWIIDCVLDKFNIEKTYTDKFDYTMETLGIPVAILSGIADAEELNGITSGADFDMQGFGGDADPNQELGALKRHLVRTRNYIAKNPETVMFQGGAKNNVKMLDYAIKYWDSPNRMKALTDVAGVEHKINVEMGLAAPGDFNPNNDFSGYDDNVLNGADELDGTDDLGDDVNTLGKAKAPKKFFQNVRKAAGNATARAKAGAKKAGAFAKKGFKAVVRYNPLTLAARGGFLLVMKKGLFDLAWALAPGYFTADEARQKGISEDKRQRAITALAKITKIFVNTLQGKPENLKKAILEGYTYTSKKTGKLGSFDENLGEPVSTTTAITAAATPVTASASAATAAGLTTTTGLSIFQKVIKFFKGNSEKIKSGLTIAKNLKDKRAAKKAKKLDKNGKPIDEPADDAPTAQTPDEGGSEPRKPEDAPSKADGSKIDDEPADGEDGPMEKIANKMKDVADVASKMDTEQKTEDADSEANQTTDGSAVKTAAKGTTPDTSNSTNEGFFAKAKNFVKENPGKTVAGGLVIGTVITLAVSKKARTAVLNIFSKKKAKGALSGTPKRKVYKTKRVVSRYDNFNKRIVKLVRM